MPFSNKPRGNFKESDYTLEQWHRACLIHLHDGELTSKEQRKLPVRQPDGTLNRNGVHAAAARINQVDVPLSEKQKAARKLLRLYAELKEEPPESIKKLAGVK